MKRFLPKITKHDLQTAAIIFGMAFIGTLLKGGPVSTSLLISAVGAGVGALLHSYLGKGA